MNIRVGVISFLAGTVLAASAQIDLLQFTRSVNVGVSAVTNCVPTVVSVFDSQSSPSLPVAATNQMAAVLLADGGLHQAECIGVLESAEIRQDRLQASGTITSSASGTNYVCGAILGPIGGGQVTYRASFTCPTLVRYQLTADLTRQVSGAPLSGTSVGGRVRLFHSNVTNTFLVAASAGVGGTNFTQTGLLIPQPGAYVLEVDADSSATATNPPASTAASFAFDLVLDECTLTCPPTQYAIEDGTTGMATVAFPVPSSSVDCAFLTVVCTPPTGSSLPVGTTTVNCVATDAWANATTCQFDVVVWDTATAAADDDGDGVSNGTELLAGTDPFSENSAFRILQIIRQSDDIAVTWETTPGKTNALQRSATVAAGYSDIFTVTNTSGSVTNHVDHSAGTNAPSLFYRVRVVPAAP